MSKKKKKPTTSNLKAGISVIIPTYKGEKWILKCLDSLAKQTLNKSLYEVIIIINGEKDQTEELVDKFQNSHPDPYLVKLVIDKPGVSNARNEGIKKASRNYLTFIDDDDWISENYLKALYKQASPQSIVVAKAIDIDEEGKENIDNYINSQIREAIGRESVALNDIGHSFAVPWGKLIAAEYAKSIQFDDRLKTGGEDVVYFAQLLINFDFDYKIAKDAKYYRLVREKSVSRQKISFSFNIQGRLTVIKKLNQLLLEAKDDEKIDFIKQKINGQVTFMHQYLQQNPKDEQKVLNEISHFDIAYLSMALLKKPSISKLIISYMFPPHSNTNIINMLEKIHHDNEVVDVAYNDMHQIVEADDDLDLIAESYVHRRYKVFAPPAFDKIDAIESFIDRLLLQLNKENAVEYQEVASYGAWMVSYFSAFAYAIDRDTKWHAAISEELFFEKTGEWKYAPIEKSPLIEKISELLIERSFILPKTDNLYEWCWYTILYFADDITVANKVLLNNVESALSLDNMALLSKKVKVSRSDKKENTILHWRKLMKQTVNDKILIRIENEFLQTLSSKQVTIDTLNTKLNELHSKHHNTIEKMKVQQKELNELHSKHHNTIEKMKVQQKLITSSKKQIKVQDKQLADHSTIFDRTREQLQLCYASASYRLGHTLLHEKTTFINPAKLLRKIKTISTKNSKIPDQQHTELIEERVKNKIDWPPFRKPLLPTSENLHIAVIMDTFSFESFSYETKLTKLKRKSWEEQLDQHQFDFVFFESAWSGNDDEWKFMMMHLDKPYAKPLLDLIEAIKNKNIPIVFWNKEDPTNFEDFISMASLCDYIFTTDSDCISRYKDILKHDRVYSLPFAAQPKIHNPIRQDKLREYEVCFAGSWYDAEAFADRKYFTQIVLDGAMGHQLHIYDRMYGEEGHKNRIFPEKYQPYIQGKLTYDEMLTAYRQYKVFLNVNTIYKSPTMFSRRVFELMACKTAVVSSRSDGITNLLGGHVEIVTDAQETDVAVTQLLIDKKDRKRKNHLAYRHVMEHHTYSHRLDEILDKLPIEKPLGKEKKISAITITNRIDYIDNIIENMQRQTYRNVQLILVLNSNDFDLESVRGRFSVLENDVQIYSKDESVSLGECFNFAFGKADGDYIAKMDDDDLYGAHYLSDTLLTFQYSDADIVGKKSIYVYFEGLDKTYMKYPDQEDRYSDFITGPTIVFKRHVMEGIKFIDANKGEDSAFLVDAKKAGYKIFSSDAFNFVYMRRTVNNSHTWKMDVAKFLQTCEEVGSGVKTDEAFI